MTLFLKVALAAFAFFCAVLLFTVVFVLAQSGGAKAIGVGALRAMTIYSPLYWLLVIAILAGLWWLSRRWMF